MADYAWPYFPITRFVMRVAPLGKLFPSPYSTQVQAIDMMGDCWMVEMDLAPGVGLAQGLAIEAFLDRLKGAANRIILPNLRMPRNLGTMSGSPVLASAAAQLTNMLPISTTVGATVNVGDMLGCGGQLFRALTAGTADGSGHVTVEVAPRVRVAGGIPSGTPVIISAPTAPFILSSANPTVEWLPGQQYVAPALTLRESF